MACPPGEVETVIGVLVNGHLLTDAVKALNPQYANAKVYPLSSPANRYPVGSDGYARFCESSVGGAKQFVADLDDNAGTSENANNPGVLVAPGNTHVLDLAASSGWNEPAVGTNCGICGEVALTASGALSGWPMGYEVPEDAPHFDNAESNRRWTASPALVLDLHGPRFTDVPLFDYEDLAGLLGPGGTLPLPFHTTGAESSVQDGAATSRDLWRAMENQDFLRTQGQYSLIWLERLAIQQNALVMALTERLEVINESIQLLGTAAFGEGWCDRIATTRDDE